MEENIQFTYDQKFKDLVVSLIESGRISSIEEIRRRFLIGGHNTVQRWLRKAGKEHLIRRPGIRTLQLEMTRLKEWDNDTYKIVSEHLASTGVDIN